MARHRDEVPEEEDQEMEEELQKLQFNQQLVPRAGKPIPTGELLRRLETLSKELVDLDQDTVDTDSLHGVAKQLATPSLLSHKEAGVKAYTASCLVDILKLCAPDAPFTPKQLKVGRLRSVCACIYVSNLSLGYSYPLRQSDTSCPLGPYECLQYSAQIRAHLAQRGEEHSPYQ